MQLESAQAEIPRRYLEASANNYVQLYDERGHAINPRAREYAKKLRRAQNDVLASVGVVERQPPHAGLSGSEERLDRLDAEDTAGNAIAITTTLSENLCTWWIGSIRARLTVCWPWFRQKMNYIDLARPFAILPSPFRRLFPPNGPLLCSTLASRLDSAPS